jgi:hypothetical protein
LLITQTLNSTFQLEFLLVLNQISSFLSPKFALLAFALRKDSQVDYAEFGMACKLHRSKFTSEKRIKSNGLVYLRQIVSRIRGEPFASFLLEGKYH